MSASRLGCTLPPSSVALLTSVAGAPLQRQGIRNRVRDFGNTGCCNCAGAQVLPPSAETSTCLIEPRPDHARPETSYKPAPVRFIPGEGFVIVDFTSIGNTNCQALPSGRSIVYFEV